MRSEPRRYTPELALIAVTIAYGATVTIVGRDRAKCEATVTAIRETTANASVNYLLADLSSQAQIRRLAEEKSAKAPGAKDQAQEPAAPASPAKP